VPFAATLELARRLGGFATTDLADDVLFVLRADALGPRVHIHEPQMEYRVHGGSRFLASGLGRVQRAIHRSIVEACRERPAGLPDPFRGGDARALRHVALASRMALVRAARHLGALEPGPLWLEGAGPESFWSAWACFRLGRPVAGFVAPSGGELLGLPVAAALPEAGRLLLPQRGRGALEALAWMLRGLPPLDHPLKRLPGAVMSGLLVPYQLADPRPGPLFLRSGGAMGAYLAYGAELLGGLRVQGLLGPAGHWPPLEGRAPGPEASVWAAPGAGPGTGLAWRP
jgi:hypothetical protein